jgi:aryl-alcohol dehydrogenase-like predicted oxidoreductase
MQDERSFQVVDCLEETGKRHGKSIAQTAIAWLQANPVITSPIIGANDVAQLNELLGAVGFRLSAEEKKSIDDMTAWQMQ